MEEQENMESSERMVSESGRFKVRLFAGALAVSVALGGAGFWAYKSGKLNDLKKWFTSFNKPNIESTSEVRDFLPLDQDGVLRVTAPFGVKMLEQKKDDRDVDTFYFLPSGDFDNYYLFDEANQVPLTEVTDDPRDNENVRYFQTGDGSLATGYIGVQNNYFEFLTAYDDLKASIISGNDKTYSTALISVSYDVSDLYKVPAGYEIYSDDKEAIQFAQLAYIDYNEADSSKNEFSKVYSIPKDYVNSFVAVTLDAYDILTKGDELKNQMMMAYDIYSQNMGNMGYGETTNYSR